MIRSLTLAGLALGCFVGCQSSSPMAMQNPFLFSNPFARGEQYEPEMEAKAEETAFSSRESEASEKDNMLASQTEPTARLGEASTRSKPVPDPVGNASIGDSSDSDSELAQAQQKADEAFYEENYPKAFAFYREVVRLDPNNVDAHHRLAFIADGQKNIPLAEKHYKHALALDPQNVGVMNDLGYMYLQQDRYEESANYLNGALMIEPDHKYALENLGLLAARVGDVEDSYNFFVQSGMSPEQAQQKIQTIQVKSGPSPKIAQTPGSQGMAPKESGNHFPSPTPDWGSTYGLTQQSPSAPDPQNSGIIMIEPETAVPTMQTGIRPAGNQQYAPLQQQPPGNPAMPAPQQVRIPLNYELERAAINAGPGSLFPMTSPAEYHRARQGQSVDVPSRGSLDAQPIGYQQKYSSGSTQWPTPSNNPPQQSSPRIQTPVNYQSSQMNSFPTNSAASTGQAFPVTGAPSPAQSYSQFPNGSAATNSVPSMGYQQYNDSLRRYESELQPSGTPYYGR